MRKKAKIVIPEQSGVAFAVVSKGTAFLSPDPSQALAEWDPRLHVPFPAVFGFDDNGISVWKQDYSEIIGVLASRDEVLGVSTVVIAHGRGADFYGMQIRLRARKAEDGDIRVFVKSDSITHDEYSADRIVGPAQRALGKLASPGDDEGSGAADIDVTDGGSADDRATGID